MGLMKLYKGVNKMKKSTKDELLAILGLGLIALVLLASYIISPIPQVVGF